MLILQACQNMPSTNVHPTEDGEGEEEGDREEEDEDTNENIEQSRGAFGEEILDEEIASHMNSKLMHVTSKEDMQIVQGRHSKPPNVFLPERFNSGSLDENKQQQHLEVQESVLKSLYAIGALGNKIANRDLSDWKKPVKDAITLMAQASHQLHESQSGNKI